LPETATVVYLEGSLTMDGARLDVGSTLADGTLLQTDEKGLAEIVFAGGNALRLGPNTVMRVSLGDLQRSMNIERGTVTAVFRKLGKLTGGRMEVGTPSLVAGIRGTSFFLWVSPDSQETYFCTCNGKLEFSPGSKLEKILSEASHHDALIFNGTGETVTVSKPGPGYNHRHGDADLETLAARIGETMDWSRVEE
jgi:hypothetical protein